MADATHTVMLGLRFYDRRPLCTSRIPHARRHHLARTEDPRWSGRRHAPLRSRDLSLFLLFTLSLAPPATAAPHRAPAPCEDVIPTVIWAVYAFLVGMLLGFVIAFALAWQLVTAADSTAARRRARQLAALFGQTDDIHDLMTRVIRQGHSRINALKDDLERLRKELRHGK